MLDQRFSIKINYIFSNHVGIPSYGIYMYCIFPLNLTTHENLGTLKGSGNRKDLESLRLYYIYWTKFC